MTNNINRTLKVLRIASDIYPYEIGGLPVHVHNLSKDLSTKGFYNLVLICSNNIYMNNSFLSINSFNYDIICNHSLFSILGNKFSIELIKNIFLLKNNFDIIHAHSHLFLSTVVIALIKRLTRSPPLIITNHGIMSASAPNWFNIFYMMTVGKITLESANKIICYTEIEKETLIRMLGLDDDKIVIIHNGVDTDLFHLSNALKKYDILWVGRFVRGKGVELLIQAAARLKKLYPNLKILLIGDGPLKSKMSNLINEFDLQSNVIIRGFSSYENMPDIYQQSEIFVLPSLNEGVPKSMMEAMSCGLPVIISDLPHLRDIVQDCGLMFARGDLLELIKAISFLLDNKEYAKKLGSSGRDKILRNYSWKNTVAKIGQLYNDMAQED